MKYALLCILLGGCSMHPKTDYQACIDNIPLIGNIGAEMQLTMMKECREVRDENSITPNG